MKKRFFIGIIISIGFFSCDGGPKSNPAPVARVAIRPLANIPIQNPENNDQDYSKFIDTKLEYTTAAGKSIILENSFPKGGLHYTSKEGKDYLYAIFWTRITNKTGSPFNLKFEFSNGEYLLPSSNGNNFKIVIPSREMDMKKVSLFNYGLSDLNAILHNKLKNSVRLHRSIGANQTVGFYVITLFKKAVKGTVRAGFSLKNNSVYYKVNDIDIECGEVDMKNLQLKK